MMAQWLVHLLHKQKVGVQFPVVAELSFPQVFSFFPFRVNNWTDHCSGPSFTYLKEEGCPTLLPPINYIFLQPSVEGECQTASPSYELTLTLILCLIFTMYAYIIHLCVGAYSSCQNYSVCVFLLI